jgi:hypothetical protein
MQAAQLFVLKNGNVVASGVKFATTEPNAKIKFLNIFLLNK